MTSSHPAKFHDLLIDIFDEVLAEKQFEGIILDPFAGVGTVHKLSTPEHPTLGIELEPEWAYVNPMTTHGDCVKVMRKWRTQSKRVQAIITSPAYGNRFADKDMRESCAGTYMKSLGHEASEGSSCHLQWPSLDYKTLHVAAYQAATMLGPWLFVLNIKDHYRGKTRQHVAGWHVGTLQGMGWIVEDIIPVPTPSMKKGENRERATELVVVMTR